MTQVGILHCALCFPVLSEGQPKVGTATALCSGRPCSMTTPYKKPTISIFIPSARYMLCSKTKHCACARPDPTKTSHARNARGEGRPTAELGGGVSPALRSSTKTRVAALVFDDVVDGERVLGFTLTPPRPALLTPSFPGPPRHMGPPSVPY